MPALIAFLSLGFFSQSPMKENTPRRMSSVDCVDCARDPITGVQLPSVMPYFVNANASQSNDSFLLFSRQVDFQSRLNQFNMISGFNRMFSRLPAYPSYVLPSVAGYQVNLAKPAAASNQIFSGLTADPALKYLTQPGIDARTNPSVATGIGPKVLDVAAVLEANLGLAPNPNSVVSSKDPVKVNDLAVPASTTQGGETVVPKTQDRITATTPSSSLLGSRPVKQPISPQISFSSVK